MASSLPRSVPPDSKKEQIFVEKLKSMLKLGAFSGRYKDVFDMYFLKDKLSKRTLKAYMKMYIFDDKKMRERDGDAAVSRVKAVLAQKSYARGLRNKKFAWIDTDPSEVVSGLVKFLNGCFQLNSAK